MEIDLGRISAENLESEFILNFKNNFVRELEKLPPSVDPPIKPESKQAESSQALLIRFLESGIISKKYKNNPISADELFRLALVKDQLSLARSYLELLMIIPSRKRILYHFTDEQLMGLTEVIKPGKNWFASLKKIIDRFQTADPQSTIWKTSGIREVLWHQFAASLLTDSPGKSIKEADLIDKIAGAMVQHTDLSFGEITALIKKGELTAIGKKASKKFESLSEQDPFREDLSGKSSDKQLNQPPQRIDPKEISFETPLPADIIRLENAGLILIAPYLADFFKELNLTQKDQFDDEEEQFKAVHLLQYLSTGQTGPYPEHNLVLNKLLCGMEVRDAIPLDPLFNQKELEAADELLEAVAQEWKAVKNSSGESIRMTFIQREGRLNRNDHGWKLIVERQSWDVLIDQLPWSIGVIKLPWMKSILFVEW